MDGVIEVQINTDFSAPVILIDDTDLKTRELTVAFGSVTCDYAKAGASSLTNYALDATNWDEIGVGIYEVDFSNSELDTLGLFKYVVYGAGYVTYDGMINVVDHDPEEAIKDILDDTAAATPALIADAVWDEVVTGHDGAGKAGQQLWTDIDAVLADTGTDGVVVNSYTTAGKAEVQSECNDALVAYDPPTDTEMVTAFTEIKGATWAAGTDTLEHIRDKLTDIEADTSVLQGILLVELSITEPTVIPTGTTAVNDSATMLIGATSVTVDNTANFESAGVFQVESELVTYTGKTSTTFTGLGRAAYGTSAAAHADNTAIYGANVHRAKITLHDTQFNPEAPDSAPTLTIVDIDGNSQLTETNMTQDGALVGVYYHNFAILSSQTEEKWEFKFKVIDDSKTNYYYRERFITSQPARRADAYGGEGELYCYEDGYYNSSGTYTAWGDDYAGDVTDSETGVAIDNATVTAYRVESGVTIPDMHPPGQTKTKADGSWRMYLDVGTYTFTVRKAGIIDESFNRTLS